MESQNTSQTTPTYTANYTTADGNSFQVNAWRGTSRGEPGSMVDFGRVEVIINDIQRVTLTANSDLDHLVRLIRYGESVAASAID